MRLQMQLSDPDGKQLWSKTYTTESKDNFAMQDEITAAIASELRVVLSPTTLAATRAGRTDNPEAHDSSCAACSRRIKSRRRRSASNHVFRRRAETRSALCAGARGHGVRL